jgi:23S rRNA pseudouridine2605 synthase
MKLNHYLASAGVCSRRNAAELVKEGHITINGAITREPWFEVLDKHIVAVDGKPVKQIAKIYVLMNKPKNCVSTVSDDEGRKTVVEMLYPHIKERMFPVGRLDQMTTGLLVLTNDGELAQRLAHPRYDMKKIAQGLFLDGSRVELDSISPVSPRNKSFLRVVLHSGKYRVVRRIFESIGYIVKALDRVAYAFLNQKELPVGRWRYLTAGEVKRLLGLSDSRQKRDIHCDAKKTPLRRDGKKS